MKTRYVIAIMLLLFIIREASSQSIIITVAGGGKPSKIATETELSVVTDVSVDSIGTVFLVDQNNNKIRKVTKNGEITTIAGTGLSSFGGDNANATTALLNAPTDIALDAFGNIIISDTQNHRIRKISTDGKIITVAGNGIAGFKGDGGLANDAQLDQPTDLTIDRFGNIYFVDLKNFRIRKIDKNNIISTVVGGGIKEYKDGEKAIEIATSPQFLALDLTGNLLVVCRLRNQTVIITKVATDGTITTIAGGGSSTADGVDAKSASIYPNGISVSPAGLIYFSDTDQRIRKIDANNKIVTISGQKNNNMYSGDGQPANLAAFHDPSGLVFDKNNNLYIADKFNDCIRKISQNNIITTIAGRPKKNLQGSFQGDKGLAIESNLNNPKDVAVDSKGNIYIADTYNNRIRKVDTEGNINTVFDVIGSPYGVAIDSKDNVYFKSRNQIVRMDYMNKTTLLTIPENIVNDMIYGMAVDTLGNVFMANYTKNNIVKIDYNGKLTIIAGNGTAGFSGDGGLATSAQLAHPQDIALDKKGNIYIADTNNGRIRVIDINGTISTLSFESNPVRFGNPVSIVFDKDGSLYVTDSNFGTITKVNNDGTSSKIVGKFPSIVYPGFGGDGGSAVDARISFPRGMVFDRYNNLLIADDDNNRIRKVIFSSLKPPMVSSNKTTICAGESLTLTAVGCTETVKWSSRDFSWNDVGIGKTLTIIPKSLGSIGFRAICTSENEKSDYSTIISVIIGDIPTSLTITTFPNPINSGEQVSLSAKNCPNGTIKWHDTQAGNKVLYSGSMYDTPKLTTTTLFYASCTDNNTGCTGTTRSVIVLVIPAPPTLSSVTNVICAGQSTTLRADNCIGTIIWDNELGNGIIKVVSPNVTTNYTAICFNNPLRSSASIALKITVTPTPPMPIVGVLSPVCPSQIVQNLSVSGQNLKYYSQLLGEDATEKLIPTIANPTYYVSQTINGCESKRTEMKFIFKEISPPPIVGITPELCEGSVSLPLTSSGVNLKWYSSPAGGTSSNMITPSTDKVGTINYYVTQTEIDKCESERAKFSVTIKSKPTATISGAKTIFQYDSTQIEAIMTGEPPWFLVLNNQQKIRVLTSPFQIVVKPMKTTSYELISVENGCGLGKVSGSAIITVTPVLGLHGDQKSDMKIYPNPIEKTLIIESNELIIADYVIKLIDYNGKVIIYQPKKMLDNKIDFHNVQPGSYILEITSTKYNKKWKVVKR